MELGTNISNLRREKCITQEALAAELGVTAAAVSKWEKGTTLPDVFMVCALADFFDVTTDELLGRNRKPVDLVVMTEESDRNVIEGLLRSHGFRAAAYCTAPEEAGRLHRELGTAGVLHMGPRPLTEAENNRIGRKVKVADCAWDEPYELRSNLNTILSIMEKHF